MNRRSFFGLIAIAALAAMTLSGPALAAKPEIFATNGIAINGTDPVAYFTEGDYAYGDEAVSAEWNGATWLFTSEEHRDLFLADPEKYAPQYGGYCAFALAHNAIATTVPEAWTIHNDKLYLNYSTGVRTQWQTDKDGFIEKADGHWPDVLD